MTAEQSSHNHGTNPDSANNQAKSETTHSCSIEVATLTKHKRTMVSRVVLLILMIAVLFVFVPMLKIFLTPIILACTFASLFFPFYIVLLGFFRGNRGMSALSCCIMIALGFMIPVYFVGYLVTQQLLTLYQLIGPTLQAFIQGDDTGFLTHFAGNPLLTWLTRFHINWQSTVLDTLKTTGATIAPLVNKTSMGILEIIINLFMTLFIMFYLFIDSERIVKKFRRLLPLCREYQDMIITRFLLVSRATVKGTLVIAAIQGALGALILLVFGVDAWLLWGVVMIGFSLIPMMGAWIVLIPAGLIQMAMGHVWQGVVILALSFGIVSTIDNILRPRLVGQSARMHDLLIFFSTIGGLSLFGPVGVVTGPVIMAFFVSITEIYTMELEEHLGKADTI